MNAVDTNILVYAIDRTDQVKRRKARELIDHLATASEQRVIPWQAAGELLSQLRRWERTGRLDGRGVEAYLRYFVNRFDLLVPSRAVLERSFSIYRVHRLSHWDSMIVAACLDAGVKVLYTEDMGAPRLIESVQLVNPFVP
jgi:predicted nucleic acid-binding protein